MGISVWDIKILAIIACTILYIYIYTHIILNNTFNVYTYILYIYVCRATITLLTCTIIMITSFIFTFFILCNNNSNQ